jgi:transposase-like protein
MEFDRNQQYCHNPDCPDFGKVGAGNIGIHCRKDHRFYCTTCKMRFSAREGTLFYNLKTQPDKVLMALKALANHNSIRGAADILGVSTNTIMRWLRRIGKHANEISKQLIRELNLSQVQCDELWSFVEKKR